MIESESPDDIRKRNERRLARLAITSPSVLAAIRVAKCSFFAEIVRRTPETVPFP